MADFRIESKKTWVTLDGSNPSTDQLQLGCLQRIADATEVMVRRWNDLVEDRDRFERYYKIWRDRCDQRDRTIAALRGVITKLRKQSEARNA